MYKKITFLVLTLAFLGILTGCPDSTSQSIEDDTGASVEPPPCEGEGCGDPPPPPEPEKIFALTKISTVRIFPDYLEPSSMKTVNENIIYEYKDGKLKSVFFETDGATGSNTLMKETFKYNDSGNLIEHTEYKGKSIDEAEKKEKHIYTYDSKGRLASGTRQLDGSNLTKEVYSYSGYVRTIQSYLWDGNNEKWVEGSLAEAFGLKYSTQTFNDKGLPSESSGVAEFTSGKIIGTEKWKYSDESKFLERDIQAKVAPAIEWMKSYHNTIAIDYDDKGLANKYAYKEFDQSKNCYKTHLAKAGEYDQDGNLLSEKITTDDSTCGNWDTSESQSEITRTFEYKEVETEVIMPVMHFIKIKSTYSLLYSSKPKKLFITIPPDEEAKMVPLLNAPGNGADLEQCTGEEKWTFKWSKVPGATKYELMIVHPEVESPIELKSNIEKNEFKYSVGEYTFMLDDYLWRVRANVDGSWQDWSAYNMFDVTTCLM